MFELWIATYCAVISWTGCVQRIEVYRSSDTAVGKMVQMEQDEFWLYPVKIGNEEWHLIVDRTPKVERKKK